MRLLTILQEIVNQLEEIWIKIQKLNKYWSTTVSLTTNTTNGSGYTVTSSACSVMENMMNISISFTMSTARSNGTSIRGKVCHLVITGLQNVCSDDTWVMQTVTSTIGTTGPLMTGQLLNSARTDADTIDIDFYLGGNVGGATNTTDTYTFRFPAPIPRKISLS